MIKKAAFLELREQAVALRRAGRSRREIKALLGDAACKSMKAQTPRQHSNSGWT
jgi:hypothetical protein